MELANNLLGKMGKVHLLGIPEQQLTVSVNDKKSSRKFSQLQQSQVILSLRHQSRLAQKLQCRLL